MNSNLILDMLTNLDSVQSYAPLHKFCACFKNKLYSQIDAGETVLAEYQHKLNELVSIYSDSCKDIDELTEDFSAYKKKFIMVKEECMCFLPEGTPNISSPSVAKSQPSTAEKSNV